MEFDITIDLSGYDELALKKALENIDTLKSGALDRIGSSTVEFITGWYQEKGNDYFDNPNSPTHGSGRQDTRWAEGMLQGWTYKAATDESIIGFTHPTAPGSFYYKVHGGTITAKNKRFLTIPVNPLAHGKKASELEAYVGIKLSLVPNKEKNKAFLMGNINGEDTAMYVLKRSIHVDPWPNAVPQESEIKAKATESALAFFIKNLG